MIDFKSIKQRISILTIIKIVTVALILLLPYYLFSGKLYVGGDDMRLFYAYPYEYLQNVTYFAWFNVSSIGINVSNQYLLPFLYLWSFLSIFIKDKMVLSYFAFSLPLIIGFFYFPRFVSELFPEKKRFTAEYFIGSLFYIFSPILIFDQLFIFLTSVWLIGIFPAIGYYYLRYLKTSQFKYVYISMLILFVFSFTLLTIPWLFGLLLPLIISSVILLLLGAKKEIMPFIKRTFTYVSVILFSQAFWFLGFIAPYLIKDNNSFAQRFLSQSFIESYRQTIDATATGTIIYPLLNLFHRQIAFDYDWKLKHEFVTLYDKTYFLNAIFLLVIGVGFISYKKYFSKQNRRTFLFILSSFLLCLYFFTVNIGPLKQLFLFFGNIPGFVMFRNFYDKFAPGYTFLYAVLFTVSLIIVKMRFPRMSLLVNAALIGVILLNFSTVKSTVNSPLWTTENVYKTMTFPREYLHMMDTVRNTVSPTNNILSVPFGSSLYTVVKDETSDNVYVGTSPVKVFSGVNDISGHLSFNFTKEADVVDKIIIDQDYKKFNEILYTHNINYVLVTKNIPEQVLKSYAFGQDTIASQDAAFITAIVDKKIASSEQGNYDLYTTKKRNSLLVSDNLSFKKRNAVSYELSIKNIKRTQSLYFNDSYHAKWNIFPERQSEMSSCTAIVARFKSTQECRDAFRFFTPGELQYLWRQPIFGETHISTDGRDNIWYIDPEYIKRNVDREYYTINKDGSINITMILYFKPQLFLYYGALISFSTIFISTLYLLFTYVRKLEKN